MNFIHHVKMVFVTCDNQHNMTQTFSNLLMSQPHFGLSVRVKPTLLKVGS
jgi:hypothetical protein